jgi:translation elongation factor EF-G
MRPTGRGWIACSGWLARAVCRAMVRRLERNSHGVDSSEAAFKMAGSMAFRNVFQEARPCLLERAAT